MEWVDEDLLDEPETEPSSSTDNVSEEIASSVLSHLGEQVNNPTLETFDPIILSLLYEQVATMETPLLNSQMPTNNASHSLD